jgi:hypothetical protein
MNVAAIGPPALFESLPKGRKTNLRFWIVLGVTHQHADAPHSVCLLRSGGEWPRHRRTAEKPDELAPLHAPPEYTPCPMPKV